MDRLNENKSGLQTKTDGHITYKRKTTEQQKHWSATLTNANIYRIEIFDTNCHISYLVLDILIKQKNGLNLVLWLAKLSANMAMLKNITKMTTLCDRNTAPSNSRQLRTENAQINNTMVVTKLSTAEKQRTFLINDNTGHPKIMTYFYNENIILKFYK